MAKKVTVIPAISGADRTPEKRRLRVCAYARVSTGSSAQAESYAAQVSYYTEKIGNNPLWEFAGVYADEGATGTKVKGREEFQAMLEACAEGSIDLVMTKSITRFARNTVESIQTIRDLKARGVGVYFEKENINTLTEKSELMLSILSSIAQGESEDISGNNRWSIIKRFEDGTYITGTPAYGYRNDEHGCPQIVKEEAEVVRWIFEAYLNGMGTYMIAKQLNEKGVPTIREAEKWSDGVVKGILKNPVYEGNIVRQRTYTPNQFPFTRRMNHGELPMYEITDGNPPIITHEEAAAVRKIMEYRYHALHMDREKGQNRYLFSGRIICGECGSHFRRRKIYIGKPYEKVIWTCHRHVKDKNACRMKAVREDAITDAFLAMWNKLYTNRGTVLEPLLKELNCLAEEGVRTEAMEELNTEIQNLNEQSRILNEVMKKGYMDPALFMEKNSLLAFRLTECRRKKSLLAGKLRHTKEIVKTRQLIGLLEEQDGILQEFREELFDLTVKEIRISGEHDITFCLHNGLMLTEKERGGADAVAHADRV